MTTLVIDRNPLEGEVYEYLFANELADIFPSLSYLGQAYTFEEGKELTAELKPDIIILDVMISDNIRGLDILTDIIHISPESFIIIVTNVEDFHLLQGAMYLGINHYYLKPLSLSNLKKSFLNIESRLSLSNRSVEIQSSHSRYKDLISAVFSASNSDELNTVIEDVWNSWQTSRNITLEGISLQAIIFASEIYFAPSREANHQILLSSTYNHFVKQISENVSKEQLKSAFRLFLEKSSDIINNQGQSTGLYEVETAIRLIEHYVELEEDFTLESIAKEVYISPYYLSRLFKQVKLKNFSDFVIDARIEKAKRLLETTDQNILTIATRCGYSEPNSFRRVFKAKTTCSPTQYRKTQPTT